jgi:hypothetical protein
MRILVEVIDARGVERGRAPLDAVDDVTETEQIFSEISSVLTGNASNQRDGLLRYLRMQ